MSDNWRSLIGAGLLTLSAGCRESQPLGVTPGGELPLAPLAAAPRAGAWLGGPEAPSGKLRSGIVTYYQFASQPPGPVAVTLRLEETVAADARVEISLADGARFADPRQPTRWRLMPHKASQWSLAVVPDPQRPSYLNIFTAQAGRHSAKSILLPVPQLGSDAQTAGHGPSRERRGEPVMRLNGTAQ